MELDTITTKRRKNFRIIAGVIVGTILGLFFGIAMVGLARAIDEIWVGSYFDIIIYATVGIVTGVIFGAYAKPTYNAIHGGILGVVIAIGLKGLVVLLGWGQGGEIEKFFGTLNSAIFGFGIGAIVGATVQIVTRIQQNIDSSRHQNKLRNEQFIPIPESEEVRETNDQFIPLPEHKYRLRGSHILLNFVPLLYFFPATLCVIGGGSWLVFDIFQTPDGQLLGFTMLACLGPILVVVVLFCIYLMITFLSYGFGTYLRVSSDGLEYLRWPYFGMRCRWKDVERLGKRRWATGREYDVLYLKRSAPYSWQLSTKIRQIFGINTNWGILLTGLQGWPTGQLADDLRHYVPHIFLDDKLQNEIST